MDEIDDHEIQGQELFKRLFKQDFTVCFKEILDSDLDHYSHVTERSVMKILDRINQVAIRFGRKYIADDVAEENDDFGHFSPVVEHGLPLIGQGSCFMELLRECDPDSEEGKKLWEINGQAVLVGEQVSRHLIEMMVVMNVEKDEDMMNEYRTALDLFPFLKDVFDSPERTWYNGVEYQGINVGVVYDRINALMKQAHREFVIQVTEISTIEAGSLGNIEDLCINLDNKEERDSFLYDLLDEIVEVIAKLECLLSFPLLPEEPMLPYRNIRSVKWLKRELKDMGTKIENNIGKRVEELVTKYTCENCVKDIEAFLARMDPITVEIWEDLLSEVPVEIRSLARGRVRLDVKAKLIKLYDDKKNAEVQIEGIHTRKEAEWYTGRNIAYRIKTNVMRHGSYYRSVWGKITRAHGVTGIFHAKFPNKLVRKTTYQMRVYVPTRGGGCK